MSAAPTPVGGAEGDDSDPASQASTRKRVFDLLSQSLSQTGRKKKHKKYPYLHPIESINIAHIYRDDILLPYVRAGRWIPRAFSPFLNITSMFWIGMSAGDHEETENAFISQLFVRICMCLPKLTRSLHFSSDKERNHLVNIHNSVLDMIPGFRNQMPNFGTDPEALDHVIDVVCIHPFSLMVYNGLSDDRCHEGCTLGRYGGVEDESRVLYAPESKARCMYTSDHQR